MISLVEMAGCGTPVRSGNTVEVEDMVETMVEEVETVVEEVEAMVEAMVVEVTSTTIRAATCFPFRPFLGRTNFGEVELGAS